MPGPVDAGGGGPVTRIGFDAGDADTGLAKLKKRLDDVTGGMKAFAIASMNYNAAGKMTDGVIRGMTKSGTQIDAFVSKVKGGWEVAAVNTRQSIDKIIREQERLAKTKAKAAQDATNLKETGKFRTQLNAFSSANVPVSTTQTEQRFFVSAQRDLEKFVAAGKITAQQAEGIIDDLKHGITNRLKGVEEDFRVAALRMFNAAQNLRERTDKAIAQKQGVADAQQVKGVLGSTFGPINPAATSGAVGRIENTFNRLAASVENTSVPLSRFKDLVTKTMSGVADPTNKAERSIVRLVKSISAEYDRAAAAGKRLVDAQNRVAEAAAAKTYIQGRLGKSTTGLSEGDTERVQAQIARIQGLMTRSTNSLSTPGMQRSFDAGLGGKANLNLQGAEEQARKAGARIRQIITGQLKDPFSIKVALDNNFNIIQKLYAGQFIARLTQDFEQFVSQAAEFQRSIALIQTITSDVHVPFDTWANSIRKVSDELGKPIAEVAAAGYDVLSNQVTQNVDDTVSVLRTAGQFARITNSNTEDSINLLSSAINTFKLSSGDAERVAAQFFTTIDLGRVKTNEMANTIGRSAVFAKTLGVSLEELQAGIITITQTGQKADSSFTLLNNVFQKLLNPTKELQGLYDKLGVGTGEIFVKTYGFTGALKVLAAQTGGSKAKLADFFNEIRAFGGIDALISRSTVFEGALKSLGTTAEENAEKAKKKFDELPGQRFLEEMNKIKNLFLTTFQTNLLTKVLALTDGFGGLAKVVKVLTIGTVSLGGALGLVWGVNKVWGYVAAVLAVDKTTALLNGTWAYSALLQRALWGGAALGIVAVITYMEKLHQDSVSYYDDLADAAKDLADKQIAEAERAMSAIRKKHEEDLGVERKRALEVLRVQVQAAQDRVKAEKDANKRIAESVKNSFENAYGTARNILDELREKQKEALKVAENFAKSGRARLTNERDENLFRNRLQRNDTINGGNATIERRLYRDRLRQLNNLINGAAKKGDMELATKFLDQKDQILNEIANKTVHRGGRTYMKYVGGDAAIKKNTEYRYQVEAKIAGTNKGKALGLQTTIDAEADKLKELEDAYKEYYAFKLEDKGKPIDDSQAKALERREKARLRALKATQDYLQSSGNRDPGMQRDLFKHQSELAFQRGDKMKAGIARQFTEINAFDKLKVLQQNAITGLGDDAQERFKQASEVAEDAKKEYLKSWSSTGVEIQNLAGRHGLLPDEPLIRNMKPENPADRFAGGPGLERTKITRQLQKDMGTGDYDAALKGVERLTTLFADAGRLKRQVLGEDGQYITIQTSLDRIKDKILATQAASRTAGAAEQRLKEADKNRSANAKKLDALESQIRTLGTTSEAVTQKMIGDQGAYNKMLRSTEEILEEIIKKRKGMGLIPAEQAEINYNNKEGKYDPANITKVPGTVIDSLGNISHKAGGGYIHPGKPEGTDTIPAWLTEGEYIMPADKTAKYRTILERMRAGHFATGGAIQVGGHPITDALTGGFYGQTKRLLKKHEDDLKSKMGSSGSHASRFRSVMDEYEPIGLGFSDGGVVGDFRAQLKALNSGFGSYGADGGGGDTHVGDINITVQGGDTGTATVQEIGNKLNRALRSKAISLRVK